MNSETQQHFLFPHLILTEKDFRHLSVLLPHLLLLQVTRPPEIPDWAQDSFAAWPVAREAEAVQAIQQQLQAYQSFAQIHGDQGLVASLRQEWTDDVSDSRFRIQSQLKGKDVQQPETGQLLFQEAAIFMELARNLDESETELEHNFGRVAHLEEEFRQIIGVTEGEETESALEVGSSTLVPEKAHLAFMLPVRMSQWFRLLSHQLPDAAPILVSVIPEVSEELLDCLSDQRTPIAEAEQTLQVPLASIPTLEHLPNELFEELRQELIAANRLQPYWSSLQDVLANPADGTQQKQLASQAGALRTHLAEFCKSHNVVGTKEVSLQVTHLERTSLADLWAKLDKKGFAALGMDPRLQNPIRLLTLR